MRSDRRAAAAPGALSVEVSIAAHCAAWHRVVGDAAGLCRRAARGAWTMAGDAAHANREAEVALVLTDDAEIARLNGRFRGIDGPTDVLSFPAGAPLPGADAGAPVMLGDIAIALETTARQAEREARPLGDRLQHLVVHGILHLVGYDHRGAREAADMEALEVEILTRLGVPDPYAEGTARPRRSNDERARRT